VSDDAQPGRVENPGRPGLRSRESLLVLSGVTDRTLTRLEIRTGRKLPALRDYWHRHGVPRRVSSVLVRHGLLTLNDCARLTREEFLFLPGLERKALAIIENLLGYELPSPGRALQEGGVPGRLTGLLLRAGITTLDQLRTATDPTLRKAGLSARDVKACRHAR